MALTGEQIKAKYLAEAEKNKNMHNPQPATPSIGTQGSIPPANSYNPPNGVVGASTYQPTAQPSTVGAQGYTPPTIAPNLSQGQSSYFDKSYGGIDKYVGTQQGRYDTASAQGDTDMLGKLNADASRVGYAFKPYQATATPVQPQAQPVGYTPQQQDAVTSVRSSSELQQQSGDGLAIERAALKNAIDTTMQGLRNNASYSNKLIGDERRLNDSTRTQTADPFKNLGRTSFNEGLVQRGRDIDDSARGANLDNELNSYTQEMMNFDRLSPERQRQIYAELLEKERVHGYNVADRTGTYAGQRTLAGSAQDYAQNPNNPQNVGQGIQNQLAQLQLANYPEQVKQQAALFEQELASGKMSQEAAKYNLDQLTNPESATNKAKALELKMAELEAANLPETQRLELQKLRKQIADIGVVHYKPQTAAEKEYDEAQVRKINAEIAKIEGGSAAAPELNTALANSLKSTYSMKNSITGQEIIDKDGLRNAIIASLNTDEEIDQMLGYFGLPIN